jgi:hypothetical protein
MSGEAGSNRVALVHPARRAGVIAVIAALLLAGLLLLERSGPSPVRNLRNISTGQAAQASPSGPAGQSGALAPRSALPARLNGATISGGGASQIISTAGNGGQVICTQFTGGTATTVSTVFYDSKNGTITKVTEPGSFWYFVKVQVTTPGTQSFTVTQSTTYMPTTGDPYFELGGGSSAYDGSCNTLTTTVTGGGASTTLSFTAATAGTYILSVKAMTHSVVGSSPASDTPGFSYNYTFATTGSSGSTQGVQLTHV